MRMEDGGKAVRYECTRCGACCRWAGDVCIETDEIREISRFLDMDEQVFIDTSCRLRANRRGLSIRDAEDGAVVRAACEHHVAGLHGSLNWSRHGAHAPCTRRPDQ